MSKYTKLTLKYLRDRGWKCQVVEKFESFTRSRIDLFSIIDIIAIKEGRIAGVQSTSISGRTPHIEKITKTNAQDLADWVASSAEFHLICWKKSKIKRGGIAFRYVPVVDSWSPIDP